MATSKHMGKRHTAETSERSFDRLYDAFISHASEDKADFVRPLVNVLESMGLRVWFDEFELSAGDALAAKIEEGLSRSRFGVVVVSPNFMKKKWTRRELEVLHQRGERLIPIWHKVDEAKVSKFDKKLAELLALTTRGGLHKVATSLLARMRVFHDVGAPVIEGYHACASVMRTDKRHHYLQVLQVGGVFRVPRGTRLAYTGVINNSSPLGSIDVFCSQPARVSGLDAQVARGGRIQVFELIGPQDASVMPISALLHTTKRFARDDGFVAVGLPYLTKHITLMFDYSGLTFVPNKFRPHVEVGSHSAKQGRPRLSLTHWRAQKLVCLQGQDLPAGCSAMIRWGSSRGSQKPRKLRE